MHFVQRTYDNGFVSEIHDVHAVNIAINTLCYFMSYALLNVLSNCLPTDSEMTQFHTLSATSALLI